MPKKVIAENPVSIDTPLYFAELQEYIEGTWSVKRWYTYYARSEKELNDFLDKLEMNSLRKITRKGTAYFNPDGILVPQSWCPYDVNKIIEH